MGHLLRHMASRFGQSCRACSTVCTPNPQEQTSELACRSFNTCTINKPVTPLIIFGIWNNFNVLGSVKFSRNISFSLFILYCSLLLLLLLLLLFSSESNSVFIQKSTPLYDVMTSRRRCVLFCFSFD